ncbi:MAG: glutamate-5-semialdehyde dehydrogenase, partial [Candidatus Delongbacteria bacterium]|nr:glutamate-5-semialdehyde dehydrogenase [Candidatus Delongbacteria bacterium]
MNLNQSVLSITQRIDDTKPRIQSASTSQKNHILSTLAELLSQDQAKIMAANRMDIESARQAGKNPAFIDRLTLNESRIASLIGSLKDIRDLPDPVGSIENLIPRPSGIMVGRMKVPLGAILMIYEARPNVTIDAAALCIKTGNVAILRGGTESLRTSLVLTEILHQALQTCGFPPDWIIYLDNPDKELLYRLLKEKESIDVVIPRGGAGLIRSIYEHSIIPVIGHFQGICHIYVHTEADPEEDYRSARRIIINAKVQRPGVCNAMECLLVDESIARDFLPRCAHDMIDHQ